MSLKKDSDNHPVFYFFSRLSVQRECFHRELLNYFSKLLFLITKLLNMLRNIERNYVYFFCCCFSSFKLLKEASEFRRSWAFSSSPFHLSPRRELKGMELHNFEIVLQKHKPTCGNICFN